MITKTIVALILLYSLVACAAHGAGGVEQLPRRPGDRAVHYRDTTRRYVTYT